MSSSLLLAQDVWHQTFLMLGDPELKVSLSQVDSQRAPWVIEADHSVVLAYSMSRLLRKSIGASGLWFKELDLLAAIRRQATRLLVTEQIDFSYVDAQECLMQRHVAQAFYEIELLFGVSDAAFATRDALLAGAGQQPMIDLAHRHLAFAQMLSDKPTGQQAVSSFQRKRLAARTESRLRWELKVGDDLA